MTKSEFQEVKKRNTSFAAFVLTQIEQWLSAENLDTEGWEKLRNTIFNQNTIINELIEAKFVDK